MTRNDDFDHTLEAWLRREAPSQAPDRVLDAALERVAGESQQRSWLQRLLGGTPMAIMTRTTAVAAVVAVAALIGFQLANLTPDVGSSPSPMPSGSAEPTASTTPSAALSSPELVLRLLGGAEGGRYHVLTVLDDGRVISGGEPGTANPIVERRLTPAGVQLLRDEMEATGLTDTSADYLPVANPGVEPPGYGGAGPSLEVGRPGGATVVVTWFLFGDTEQDYFQPQPEAEALNELFARLTTLDEWLPDSAWADDSPAPYAAEAYRLTILDQEWGGNPDDLPVEMASVAWPLDTGIEAFGEVVGTGFRCGMTAAAEAAEVERALEEAGATPSDQGNRSFQLSDRANVRLLVVTLDPVLPLDDSGCQGATVPF